MQDTIKILLVDDEARNLDALESILDDPSYALLRATDADSALKLLLDHDVAAIVLDIKMPGVSGFELAQLIKGTKRFRHIPIVFLSAYHVDDSDVLTGYGAGGVDYLTKPVNPLILRHKVAVFADLFRKTRALAELNEQLEERVRERTAELEHASRMKDQFLATVSHELRTPLNAMLGWASVLRKDPVGDPTRLQRGLEVIERNARAQERLITDLLDVSRIVSGKLRVKMQKLLLGKTVQAAVDVVRQAAAAKGVRLVMDLDPAAGVVVGDPDRLQQVVWNLLVNAIRHTPHGGAITVSTERDGTANVIRVRDTGSGIPAEHLPFIFERFRQVDSSTTRAHGGLGLGLALVRHLVEAHGGSVEAHSDGPGHGATFTVWLPTLGVIDLGAPPPPEEAVDDTAGAGSRSPSSKWRLTLGNVRVLAVDDDADSLDLVRVTLEDAGATVTCATSAGLALGALDAERFDVLVSDIAMPEVDGLELIAQIRARKDGKLLPAIALTAHARTEDAERIKQAGYQQHLVKPVDVRQLVDAIKQLAASGDVDRDVRRETGA